MKISLLISGICLLASGALFGQSEFLERQAEKAKNKVVNRVENKIDEGMEAGLDKTEESIEEGVKSSKKDKKNNTSKGSASDQLEGFDTQSEELNEHPSSVDQQSVYSESSEKMVVYSKFDFIPGEKVIIFDNFETTNIGDYPMNWNTNASGEVVSVSNSADKFFKLSNQGVFHPDNVTEISENATIEFDLLPIDLSEMQSGLKLYFTKKLENPIGFDHFFNTEPTVGFDIHPAGGSGYCFVEVYDRNATKIIENTVDLNIQNNQLIHVSIWRQKTRIRLYLNEVKVFDLPRVLFDGVEYDLIFATNIWEGSVSISNLRLAVGAPDTRTKLITEGKLVSRGILFDTNSDQIKPSSYGTLKEIATMLKENPSINVQIVGHTDSDGSDEANLILSKKRAEAVKAALNKEFGINLSRMTTDGKGETQPSDPNTTSAGKANNRRVEFIKTN